MAIPVALGVAGLAAAKGAGGSGIMSGLGGSLIGAGTSIFGGLLGSSTQEKLTQRQLDLQREFAQHGIQWRVEDAKRAGIHPAAALGAFPTSAQPIIMEDPLGKSIASAGQDISQAVDRTLNESQKETMRLNQELMKAQIRETDARAGAISSDMMRKNQEPSPGFPMVMGGDGQPVTGLEGQAPIFPRTEGFYKLDIPTRFNTNPGKPEQETGMSPAFEPVRFNSKFMMWMPSGRGQESPHEIWENLSPIEKWSTIMYNVQTQGPSWVTKLKSMLLTGDPEFKGIYPMEQANKDIIGAKDSLWSEINRLQKKFLPSHNPKGKGR